MKKVICLLLFCSQLHSQCEECFIIRGDANCDGVVNLGDVAAIMGGTQSNDDAADVNDDGVVDPDDAIWLSKFLFNGGAPPDCPVGSGHDCTPDNLEGCCSPPITLSSDLLPTNPGAIFQEQTEHWDFHDGSWVAYGQQNKAKLVCRNVSSCSHPFTRSQFGIVWDVLDDQWFTKKRLQSGVQTAKLRLTVDTAFARGAVCNNTTCDDTNRLIMRMEPGVVSVVVGYPLSVFRLNLNTTKTFSYSRQGINGNCSLSGAPSALVPYVAEWDITDELAGIATDDCTPHVILGLSLTGLEIIFTREDGDDIATTEKVEAEVKLEVSYGWCECS